MTVQTITHSIEIMVEGNDTPIEVTDATAALAALEGFKMGAPYITVPVSGEGDTDCTLYINTKNIIAIQDCPTIETQTVTDATCDNVVTE